MFDEVREACEISQFSETVNLTLLCGNCNYNRNLNIRINRKSVKRKFLPVLHSLIFQVFELWPMALQKTSAVDVLS